MEAYSLDLRRRVVAAVEGEHGTWQQIADRFGVNRAFVAKLMKRRRQDGSITPRPHGGGHARVIDARDAGRLATLVGRHNDLTLHELRDRLGLSVSHMAVHRALVRLGVTRKKRRQRPPSRSVRTGRRPAKSGRSGFARPAAATTPACCSWTRVGPSRT